MENAQLVSLSRQMALQRQMDVVANNMANINTTGFKAEALLFEEYVGSVAKDRDFSGTDQPLSFTQDWATMHNFEPGAMKQTGNPLDVALQGEGFLAVDTPAGERWTKAGSLLLNAEGVLVNTDGYPVMGNGGQIQFDETETDFTINADGSISTVNGLKGNLRLVEFDRPQDLAREGSNLFSGGEPRAATATTVMQGFVEGSNVSGVTEMAEMVRVSRSYQTLANLMQQQSELRSDAIRRLGQLSA